MVVKVHAGNGRDWMDCRIVVPGRSGLFQTIGSKAMMDYRLWFALFSSVRPSRLCSCRLWRAASPYKSEKHAAEERSFIPPSCPSMEFREDEVVALREIGMWVWARGD